MIGRPWPLLAAAVAVATLASTLATHAADEDRTGPLRATIKSGSAANVILFIGDGMGDSEITMARNYHVGAAGRLTMDTLPLTGAYTTYSVVESAPALPDYVSDSASSGTAWATGVKTSNGRIATRAGAQGVAPLQTIMELAQRAGYRTGNVTTAELTDATPAVLNAHVNSRTCQGPNDMERCAPYRKEAGGPGSIAEQAVDHHVDVLLGGGRRRFQQTITGGLHAGRTVLESATLQGYSVVRDKDELAHAPQGGRLLGLFSEGDMTLEWEGAAAAPFPGTGPQTCAEGRRELTTAEPSLAEMTAAAITRLSAGGQRRRGFFLQVEGASIDKQDHAANPCQQIGETIALDRAIQVALAFAKRHRNTLVVVAADHAHTSQIVPTIGLDDRPRPGALSTLLTREGGTMTVSYATRSYGEPQEHTGAQVRIAAQGPMAANVVGITDQTQLFKTLARGLGIRLPGEGPSRRPKPR